MCNSGQKWPLFRPDLPESEKSVRMTTFTPFYEKRPLLLLLCRIAKGLCLETVFGPGLSALAALTNSETGDSGVSTLPQSVILGLWEQECRANLQK